MDIMELGAIGELVGGVAVLVTLVYLAVQVRHGTRLVRSQVHQESTRMSSETLLHADRETLDLYDRAIRRPEEVSDSDWRVVRNHWISVVNYYETLFYAWERGEVDGDLWESRRFRMAHFIAPARRDFWEPMKAGFGRRFRAFVEASLLHDKASDWWYLGASPERRGGE